MSTIENTDADPASTAELLAQADAEGLSENPKSFGQLARERFLGHRLALIGAIGLLLLIALFVFGPIVNPYDFDKPEVRDRLQGPSLDHWFGTDPLGRDLFVRTARGGRYSLFIGLFAAAAATFFGTMMGTLAGFFGGKSDAAVNAIVNLVLTVPAIIVLSVFASRFGASAIGLSLVLAGLLWTRIARVVRGVILSIKEQEYIMAARAAGASNTRIMLRHLLPNVMGAIAVEITLLVGSVIVLETTLSFLGLGVQPPNSSLGTLVADEKGNIGTNPLRVLTPGIFIVLIVLCVNFLGDGLRDALDPRAKPVDSPEAKKAQKAAKKARKKLARGENVLAPAGAVTSTDTGEIAAERQRGEV